MDDKQLAIAGLMASIRPLLKTMVRQRWLSTALLRNAARPGVIRSVLKQAYPSGANINDDLVDLLFNQPNAKVPPRLSEDSSTCSTTTSPHS